MFLSDYIVIASRKDRRKKDFIEQDVSLSRDSPAIEAVPKSWNIAHNPRILYTTLRYKNIRLWSNCEPKKVNIPTSWTIILFRSCFILFSLSIFRPTKFTSARTSSGNAATCDWIAALSKKQQKKKKKNFQHEYKRKLCFMKGCTTVHWVLDTKHILVRLTTIIIIAP